MILLEDPFVKSLGDTWQNQRGIMQASVSQVWWQDLQHKKHLDYLFKGKFLDPTLDLLKYNSRLMAKNMHFKQVLQKILACIL